ncbi:hypothetical protein J5N97_004716 [Dioscorea zingiberensis]|uniref:non-specific serine/threonine protein kinase n=1 Tax=Dioscorea zingiberensis TaxID=325984 RepID=A0A9D5D6Q3_9LILI|nr:hypothetical protein J5N97_004716 [Dioscorea zingiberensis]
MTSRKASKLFFPSHGVVPLFLFLCLMVWSSHSQAQQPLAQNEVEALKKIGAKLGKQWDFTVDPCSGTSGWVDPNSNKDLVVNVTCGACNATSCHVTSVVLKGQNLTGSLPDEFSNLTSLQVIDLTRNYLNGTIPAAWASLPLTNLTLLGNRITGTIPDEFGNIITLLAVSLEDNLIEGPLPQSLGKLVNLDRLRIDGNPVTGKIPSFISNWKKISRMRVTDLKGFGKFPPLQNMGGMIRLILRNLSISGELPDYIGDMGNLKTFDLSYNSFNSSAPAYCYTGVVNLVSSYSSTDSNSISSCLRRNLPCSGKAKNYNLFINCGGDKMTIGNDEYQGDTLTQGPSTSSTYDEKWAYSSTGEFQGEASRGYIATNVSVLNMSNPELYMTARLSPLSLRYYGLCLQNGNYTVKLHFAEIMFTDDQTYSCLERRYFDVSIQGKKVLTDFNIAKEANGAGKEKVKSFFAIGVLPDGSVVAVKQLSSKSKQGNREFVNEIGMISALQHPQSCRFWMLLTEGNQLLLVYEYMENNSLASALFGRDRDRLKLNWQTRRSICLAIARGLAYLHEESRLKIVHRDIKATNVLLDKDLNAKISDFGLARLSEENETHISTRIAGTIGYMAPEYAMRGYLTDKADVYSFGVVTLEIVSGISNTNYRPKEECVYLLDWAYVLQERGNLLELVDKSLGSHFSEKEALQMLNLALSCTNPSPSLRPTMSVVVSILDGKNPVPMSYVKPMASNSDDARFKSFEKFSYDSQSPDISTDGPWIDSSVSLQSSYEENNTKRSS